MLLERRYADARNMYRNRRRSCTQHARSRKAPPAEARRHRRILFGTLGISLSLAGEHEEAIDHLSKLASRPGGQSRALQGFFLAASFLALKRHDEAMAALARKSSRIRIACDHVAALNAPWSPDGELARIRPLVERVSRVEEGGEQRAARRKVGAVHFFLSEPRRVRFDRRGAGFSQLATPRSFR